MHKTKPSEFPVPAPPVEPFGEEGDWIVRQFFSPADLELTPEEYAARHAHVWGCFSLHRYRFQDPQLGGWVRRLGEILLSDSDLEQCRQRFLTPSERAQAQSEPEL